MPERWSPSLAVLVVNYGSHELIGENLARSLDDGFAGLVIVVDNFTTEAEQRALHRLAASQGWTCVLSEVNLGFGAGMNLAARTAIDLGATELLLLNPDAFIDPHSIRLLHRRVAENELALVAPVVLRPDGRVFSELTDLYLDRGESLRRSKRAPGTPNERVTPWVSGACFAISARLWDLLGGFDEDFFLYWEDIDLCARAALLRATVEVDGDARAVHEPGSTQTTDPGRRVKSPEYYYYNVRNRLLYASKHLDPADLRRWRRRTPGAAYRILLRGGRRQFLHPARSILPALRGIRDGERMLSTAHERKGRTDVTPAP
ncbi:glycosyltransferase family 2 protein [Mycetocola sp. 2940]|uniref:glycosyltransferase family 2 protein n=1 Tax=Mycetocola sp. 2940 TaxID=3156452 RepID=UPI003399B016